MLRTVTAAAAAAASDQAAASILPAQHSRQLLTVQGGAREVTTEDEVEVGHLLPLLVDGAVPVDGLNGHAPAQVVPCLIRQLGQEGVQEHQDDRQLIYDGELVGDRQRTAKGQCALSAWLYVDMLYSLTAMLCS